MKTNRKTSLLRTTALLIAVGMTLTTIPATASPNSAKPDDKTPASVNKAGKPKPEPAAASNKPQNPAASAATDEVTSKPEEKTPASANKGGNSNAEPGAASAKPENSKPENPGSSSASAQSEKGPKTAGVASANAKTKKTSTKLTGKERAAAAQAKKDALLPTSNYIIVFKADSDLDEEVRGIGSLKASVGKRFENAFKGVTVRLNEKQLAGLSNNPNISIIEKDSKVALVEPLTVITQANSPWGLDRIDQITGINTTYNYSVSGIGVSAYVIDTGILSSHSNFGGRVQPGFSSIGGSTEDCNGHGTHVAGTIGSSTYGAAKGVQLVPVRVLDCNGSGTISGVIAGVDWVASQTTTGLKVANMSLGGGASSALDAAVNGLISKGTTVVVAAGNDGANACNYSPARVPAAITVAASTSSDTLASYSNRGSCVDIIAPGTSILSTWHTSATAVNTISGTSMASPHVAGAVALFLQQFGFKTPAEMDQIVKSKSSKNVISSLPIGTANSLLYTDPENKIPLSTVVVTEPVPTSPTKTTKKPRRNSRN